MVPGGFRSFRFWSKDIERKRPFLWFVMSENRQGLNRCAAVWVYVGSHRKWPLIFEWLYWWFGELIIILDFCLIFAVFLEIRLKMVILKSYILALYYSIIIFCTMLYIEPDWYLYYTIYSVVLKQMFTLISLYNCWVFVTEVFKDFIWLCRCPWVCVYSVSPRGGGV